MQGGAIELQVDAIELSADAIELSADAIELQEIAFRQYRNVNTKPQDALDKSRSTVNSISKADYLDNCRERARG